MVIVGCLGRDQEPEVGDDAAVGGRTWQNCWGAKAQDGKHHARLPQPTLLLFLLNSQHDLSKFGSTFLAWFVLSEPLKIGSLTIMASTAATPAKAPRARPYRDFLTPALHRRFTKAFGLAIGVCYIESILLSDLSDPLWSWFPLGFAGIRTLLLCVPLLAVFLLRVQRNHGMCQSN